MYEELVKDLREVEEMLKVAQFKEATNLINQAADAIEVLSKKEKTTQPDERLTPKKPKVPVDTWVCPECGRAVEFQEMLGVNTIFHGYHNFCPNCGQAIDWTDY